MKEFADQSIDHVNIEGQNTCIPMICQNENGGMYIMTLSLQCIVCWNSRQTASRHREALLQQGKVQRHLSPSGRQVISSYWSPRACMYVI